jgi:propanol-preferring alcohol dehydrogenase
MIDENAENIGIYGFGAAAHLITQAAIYQHKKIYAFTRDGDTQAQQFALSLGAAWAGDSSTPSPVKLDGAIIFAPVGGLVPKALKDVDKGGTVVCGGIHMSDIPSFSYDIFMGGKNDTFRS